MNTMMDKILSVTGTIFCPQYINKRYIKKELKVEIEFLYFSEMGMEDRERLSPVLALVGKLLAIL